MVRMDSKEIEQTGSNVIMIANREESQSLSNEFIQND